MEYLARGFYRVGEGKRSANPGLPHLEISTGKSHDRLHKCANFAEQGSVIMGKYNTWTAVQVLLGSEVNLIVV